LDQASNKLNAKNESRSFSVLTSSKQELTMDRRILLKGLGAGVVSIGFDPSAWSGSVLIPSKSPVSETPPRPRTTKIIGVGGAGCNFIHSFRSGLDPHNLTNVTELVCVDLGMQSLPPVETLYETAAGSLSLKTISLTPRGAGGGVNTARAAALRNIKVLNAAVNGAGTVILVAGLGGGTGGGVLPIVARAARNAGAVTIAVVVMPFDFEGPRNGKAVTALTNLAREVDFVMPFSNQELGDSMGELYYLAGHNVREHADFKNMDSINASKAYSAVRLPVLNEIKIDFDISNEVRLKQLSEKLCELLVYPGEFTPKDHLAPYVFSRVSAPVALKQLKDIVNGVLESGPDSVPPVPTFTVYRGPNSPAPAKRKVQQAAMNQASVKPRRSRGIGNAPLQKDKDFE
jgi:hypothetical protein